MVVVVVVVVVVVGLGLGVVMGWSTSAFAVELVPKDWLLLPPPLLCFGELELSRQLCACLTESPFWV